jgi:hypothetical protein
MGAKAAGAPDSSPISPPPLSPQGDAVPPRPVSPEAATPGVSRREGKQPMPQSPSADSGPASPTEAVLHPAHAAGAARLAEHFAEDIEELMRISLFRHGQATFRQDLNFMDRLFKETEPFLDMREGLLRAQAVLKNMLARGDVSGIGQPRLRELKTLAEADIHSQLAGINTLKKDLEDARQDIINHGGNPNWISKPPRPIHEIKAERAAQIANDDEVLQQGQRTF